MNEIEEKGTGAKVDPLYTFTGSVYVPLGIAFVWGFIVTSVLFMLIGIDKINVLGSYFSPVKPIFLIGLFVLGLTWKWEVDQRRQNIKASFIQRVETVFNTDLDGDNHIGAPEIVIHEYRDTTKGGASQKRYSIKWNDGDYSQIEEVARRTINGIPFSQSEYIKGDGKLFGLERFNYLKEQLFNMRPDPFLVKADHRENAKNLWTEAGKRWAAQVTEENSTPTPPLEVVEGEFVDL